MSQHRGNIEDTKDKRMFCCSIIAAGIYNHPIHGANVRDVAKESWDLLMEIEKLAEARMVEELAAHKAELSRGL